MATNMEQYFEIFITDLEGKQNVIRFLQEQFLDTTIYSLKFQIEHKTRVVIQKQSLSFGGRKLDFKRGDKIMTFEDYGIMNGANIIMDQRLMGGKFDEFDFTDIHKKGKFKKKKLVTGVVLTKMDPPTKMVRGTIFVKYHGYSTFDKNGTPPLFTMYCAINLCLIIVV